MSSLWIALVVFDLLGSVSLYLNLCIVFINVRDLTKGLKMKPSGLIQILKGINNSMMCGLGIAYDVAGWSLGITDSDLHKVFDFFLEFNAFFGYWLTAWLCTYYSITITNYGHKAVVWLRRTFSAFLPYVLALTGVGSLAMALLYTLTANMDPSVQYSANRTHNGSSIPKHDPVDSLYTFSSTILGCCFPCVGISVCLLVTVLSLIKHIRNISHVSSCVEVHIATIKTMVMFLVLSLFLCICDMVVLINGPLAGDVSSILVEFTLKIFPAVEAAIIIQASAKLRRSFPRRLCAGVTGT